MPEPIAWNFHSSSAVSALAFPPCFVSFNPPILDGTKYKEVSKLCPGKIIFHLTSYVTQSILSQIDTSTIAALRESASMAALAKADWSWLSEVHTEEEEYENESVLDSVTESSITPEIRAEIAADITQVLSNPETMHIDSQSKYLQWKERNPGFAAFFIEILLPILLLIADWGFSSWQARTVKDSHIYEEPTSASSIVYNVTVENNVTVVGDVPYYYEVEFVNPETGELVTGYIYKGNIEAEEPDETEVHVEATEATEESEPTSDTTESQTEPLE